MRQCKKKMSNVHSLSSSIRMEEYPVNDWSVLAQYETTVLSNWLENKLDLEDLILYDGSYAKMRMGYTQECN